MQDHPKACNLAHEVDKEQVRLADEANEEGSGSASAVRAGGKCQNSG